MANWLRAIGEARPAAMIEEYRKGLKEQERFGMEQQRFGWERGRAEEEIAGRPTQRAISELTLQEAQQKQIEIERRRVPDNINKYFDIRKIPDQFRKEFKAYFGMISGGKIDPETGDSTAGDIQDAAIKYYSSPQAAIDSKKIVGHYWAEYDQAKKKYDEAVKERKDEKIQIKLREKMDEAERDWMDAGGYDSKIIQMREKIQQIGQESEKESEENVQKVLDLFR